MPPIAFQAGKNRESQVVTDGRLHGVRIVDQNGALHRNDMAAVLRLESPFVGGRQPRIDDALMGLQIFRGPGRGAPTQIGGRGDEIAPHGPEPRRATSVLASK
jgi:hypothetical protein